MKAAVLLVVLLFAGCVSPSTVDQSAQADASVSELPWLRNLDPDYFERSPITSFRLAFSSGQQSSDVWNVPPAATHVGFELRIISASNVYQAKSSSETPGLRIVWDGGNEAFTFRAAAPGIVRSSLGPFEVERDLRVLGVPTGGRTLTFSTIGGMNGDGHVEVHVSPALPNMDPHAAHKALDPDYFRSWPIDGVEISLPRLPSESSRATRLDLPSETAFVELAWEYYQRGPVGSKGAVRALSSEFGFDVRWADGSTAFTNRSSATGPWIPSETPFHRGSDLFARYNAAPALEFVPVGWGDIDVSIKVRRAEPYDPTLPTG